MGAWVGRAFADREARTPRSWAWPASPVSGRPMRR
ncbi:MAG TPA: hypothetical protein VFK66_05745 [Oryzihumus sp.]|nr:hypothetical protein [Oryzihumus sp.]